MKKNNDVYPYPTESDENDKLLKYCCPSASWGDMTGLIPYAAYGNGELESYNEVYNYLPNVKENTEENDNQSNDN